MSLLEHLGWGPFFQAQITSDGVPCARVTEGHRGQYQIAGDFEGRAELSGRFRHDAKFSADYPVVGDYISAALRQGPRSFIAVSTAGGPWREKPRGARRRHRSSLRTSIRSFS